MSFYVLVEVEFKFGFQEDRYAFNVIFITLFFVCFETISQKKGQLNVTTLLFSIFIVLFGICNKSLCPIVFVIRLKIK